MQRFLFFRLTPSFDGLVQKKSRLNSRILILNILFNYALTFPFTFAITSSATLFGAGA